MFAHARLRRLVLGECSCPLPASDAEAIGMTEREPGSRERATLVAADGFGLEPRAGNAVSIGRFADVGHGGETRDGRWLAVKYRYFDPEGAVVSADDTSIDVRVPLFHRLDMAREDDGTR